MLIAFLVPTARAEEAPAVQVVVDLSAPRYTFRGWGTSLAWWAHGVGDLPDDQLDPIIRAATDPKEGLGLNVFRYNIGGSDTPGHHHMRRWGDVPGYKPSVDSPYDWTADSAQRRVLMKLIKACPDKPILEAFSNSPPWWMTQSGCVAGATDGGANLKPECEQAFADYLADVAEFFHKQHGLTFDSLEPFNEPDVRWWKANGDQEGLHIPRDQQARLIRLTRAALDQRGLKQTLVSATDANNINDALKSVQSFDTATLADLGRINTHSYGGDKRTELRDLAARLGKPLWQSETGPLYVGGTDYEQMLKVAQRIVIDMNELKPEVWCMWQFIEGGPWGALVPDRDRKTFTVGQNFHILSAFTRHIRPGDQITLLNSKNILAALSPTRQKLSLVIVNSNKAPRTFRIALHGAQGLPSDREYCWADERDHGKGIEPIAWVNGVYELLARPQSVTVVTLPLANPKLHP